MLFAMVMTSRQLQYIQTQATTHPDVSYSDQQLSKSYQQFVYRDVNCVSRNRAKAVDSKELKNIYKKLSIDIETVQRTLADNSYRNSERCNRHSAVDNSPRKVGRSKSGEATAACTGGGGGEALEEKGAAVSSTLGLGFCVVSKAQRIEEGAKHSSRRNKSAANQLTNYQSWMSTAELNSNEESDMSLQKKRTKSVTQLRLFMHLRSLGVLTAAGCGIGSVHAVVRSNLLVEPSEVEEGEM
ncbi:hypothetical protein F511_40247 [Dorcoceras hygrometricum]|uniref:Uncharacterized protein n=1 Tax=Dorcoceras hygrometricum TaxID=472368 RepID=A0A2Z7AYE9_9LAMI|nr:hypothetical protein F511_40247 [Dorcoceras hygrometricum]